jgi:hypothetical protein
MLDSIGTHTAGNIWQRLGNALEGEADPMSYEEEQELSSVAKTNLTFLDLIDAVNPLQHIPLVSTIYRNVSGDSISDVPKFIGGALYGGPIGLVAALGSYIIEAESTKTQEPKKWPAVAANNEQMKQRQINTAKDETLEVLSKQKTNHSNYSLKNAVAQKTFPLASKTEAILAPKDIFKSGKVYPISPQNAYEVQEIRGFALDKLIQNTSKTHTSENFNRNKSNAGNHLITDHMNIESWMLEKLGKYNRLQNSK